MFGDEAVDAFRAIGYLDYLGTSFQTQPIDWYKDQSLPFWTKLSFHDFPPLAMIIQNIFFRLFGDSLLIARLPAILLGTASVFLIYLITRMLFKESVALLAAFLFSINSVMVWIFRTSLLEPILLFFILLNIYFFFKFLNNHRYWWLFGITLGLVALTKYTGIFLLPVYIIYLFIQKTALFKNWRLYAALGLALILLTPVIVYNIYLFQATGHFDLQIAYLLGQDTPEWTGLVGKIQSPFSDLWQNLTRSAADSSGLVGSYGLLAMVIVFLGFSYLFSRNYKIQWPQKNHFFLLFYFVFVTLLFMKIGSAHRFLALYGPIFIIVSALALQLLWNFKEQSKLNYFFKFLVLAIVVSEIALMFNQNFIKVPDYGVAKLDRYLEEEFKNKESAVIPESDNPHLTEVIYKFAKKKSDKERGFYMIIYNDNVVLPTLDWIFYRRFFYHSIPTLFVENFDKALRVQGADYFRGFDVYFVQSTEHTLLNQFKTDKTAALEFENNLQSQGLQPVKVIYGHQNLPMFKVYKFSI